MAGDPADPNERLPQLRLYYVRLGFLASGYINQVGQPSATLLPRNLAKPLCDACRRLKRPPILSYDGYALYNWKRFDPDGPVALGNIDTIQNFVHLYDEHWFILVHVEIEAIAADILAAIDVAARGGGGGRCGGREPSAAEDRRRRMAAGGRAAADTGKDGPGAVLQNVPAVYPVFRKRGCTRGVETGPLLIFAARPAHRAASCRCWWR